MEDVIKQSKFSWLKTSKEWIIEEWDTGMVIYAPGQFDHYRLSVIKENQSFAPYIVHIKNIARVKIGSRNSAELYYDMKSLSEKMGKIMGDPRNSDVRSEILNISKKYEKYFAIKRNTEVEEIDRYLSMWNINWYRFCLIWYSIIYSDNIKKPLMDIDIRNNWKKWGITKSSDEVEDEIQKEIDDEIKNYVDNTTKGKLERYIDE